MAQLMTVPDHIIVDLRSFDISLSFGSSLDLLCKELRDNHSIIISPSPTYDEKGIIWMCLIVWIEGNNITPETLLAEPIGKSIPAKVFISYEMAQIAGIERVIEKIKKK